MSSLSQVSGAMQRVLTRRAQELERETGFVERSTAQLDGPPCVQTTVFGWLHTPEASYAQVRHGAASLGVSVRSQAVEQRLGTESAALLREVLQEAGGAVLEPRGERTGVAESLQRGGCAGWHEQQSAAGVARRVARLWWEHTGSGTQ